MMSHRRRMLLAAGKPFVLPAYTGSYALHGDKKKGYIELFSSGTLTLFPAKYDVYLLGGGGGQRTQNAFGGSGGYTTNAFKSSLSGKYSVTIGAAQNPTAGFGLSAGAGGANKTSSGNIYYAPAGGSGGGAQYSIEGGSSYGYSAGNGGSNGSNGGNAYPSSTYFKYYGGAGQGTSTKPFLGDSSEFSIPYGAGGGGGGRLSKARNSGEEYARAGAGGYYGGGSGGAVGYPYSVSQMTGGSGTANSGGGGGGASNYQYYDEGIQSAMGYQGAGGSGLAILRWGY